MLCLAGQVSRHHMGICRFVRNDGGLGWARHHIDADAAEQRSFGLGHEAVARSDDHIGRLGRIQAEGHGRNALHAAQGQHGVGPTQLHGVQDSGVHASLFMGR